MTPNCCPPSRTRFEAGFVLSCVLAALISVSAPGPRAAEERLRDLLLAPNAVEMAPPKYGFEIPKLAWSLRPVEQTPYRGAHDRFFNTTRAELKPVVPAPPNPCLNAHESRRSRVAAAREFNFHAGPSLAKAHGADGTPPFVEAVMVAIRRRM